MRRARHAVSKFGGSSLCDKEAFKRVVRIVNDRKRPTYSESTLEFSGMMDSEIGGGMIDFYKSLVPVRKHVVVSAPGKRYPSDLKVTDMLLQCHKVSALKDIGQFQATFEKVATRYTDVHCTPVLLAALEVAASSIYDTDSKAHAASCGEYLSALLLSEMLSNCFTFVDASELVRFDPHTHNLDFDQTMMAMKQRFIYDAQPGEGFVIPGFYGSEMGNRAATVTFSRGGSDITASLVARALTIASTEVSASDRKYYYHENFTDVDGVHTCDPLLDKNASRIPSMTYDEIEAMSRAGSNVLHPFAVEPLKRQFSINGSTIDVKIPLHIRSTALADAHTDTDDGTWVLPSISTSSENIGTGLSTAGECRPMSVSGRGSRVVVVCSSPISGLDEDFRRVLKEQIVKTLEQHNISVLKDDMADDSILTPLNDSHKKISLCVLIEDEFSLDDAVRIIHESIM